MAVTRTLGAALAFCLLLAGTGCAESSGTAYLRFPGNDQLQRDRGSVMGYTPEKHSGTHAEDFPDRLCLTDPGEVIITGVRLVRPRGVVLLDAAVEEFVATADGTTMRTDVLALPDGATRLRGRTLHRLPQPYRFVCPPEDGVGAGHGEGTIAFLMGYSGEGSVDGIDIDYTSDGVDKTCRALFAVDIRPKR